MWKNSIANGYTTVGVPRCLELCQIALVFIPGHSGGCFNLVVVATGLIISGTMLV